MSDHKDERDPIDTNNEETSMAINTDSRERIAVALYRANGFAWYGRDLGDWDDSNSRIARNEHERERWLRQAAEVLAALTEADHEEQR